MDNETLFAEVALGIRTKEFLNTDTGRLITGRAEIELLEARAALEQVDPEDAKAVREIQTKAAVARKMITWLNEVIENGNQAEAILTEQDVNE